MKSKELRQKRARIIEEATATLAVTGKMGNPTPEAIAKFDAMMKEADDLKAGIQALDTAEAALAQQMEALHQQANRNGTGIGEQRQRNELENAAFETWMRRGTEALNEEERAVLKNSFRAAMGTTPDTAGGYLVPQGFYGQLVEAQLAHGGMLPNSRIIDTPTGNVLPIPTENDTNNVGELISENKQVSVQDVAFGAVMLNAWTYSSKLVLVSNQLLQDAAVDLNTLLPVTIGRRIARLTNNHFTTGNGASQPVGVLTAATLGATAGGATNSGSTLTVGFDDLTELEHSVDPAYRAGARYMMHDSTLKTLKKLKDGMGRPIWLPSVADNTPDTINGYPYIINQSMPVMAASAKPILFGNFDNYFIRRVAGVTLLRLVERYADYNQTGFLAFQRWDGNLVDAGTHPIKYLQNSAS